MRYMALDVLLEQITGHYFDYSPFLIILMCVPFSSVLNYLVSCRWCVCILFTASRKSACFPMLFSRSMLYFKITERKNYSVARWQDRDKNYWNATKGWCHSTNLENRNERITKSKWNDISHESSLLQSYWSQWIPSVLKATRNSDHPSTVIVQLLIKFVSPTGSSNNHL
jgi:hypothetical protein